MSAPCSHGGLGKNSNYQPYTEDDNMGKKKSYFLRVGRKKWAACLRPWSRFGFCGRGTRRRRCFAAGRAFPCQSAVGSRGPCLLIISCIPPAALRAFHRPPLFPIPLACQKQFGPSLPAGQNGSRLRRPSGGPGCFPTFIPPAPCGLPALWAGPSPN